jgi:hypothetical protein
MECEDDECTRGENAWLFALVMTIFPTWICMVLSIVFMGMIYFTVRGVENRGMRWSMGDTQLTTVSRAKSKLVASQALWYIAVFFITFTGDAVSVVLYYVGDHWFYYLDLFAYTILPAQGFLNFLVFLRRKEVMYSRYGKVVRQMICCCGGHPIDNLKKSGAFRSRMTTGASELGTSNVSGPHVRIFEDDRDHRGRGGDGSTDQNYDAAERSKISHVDEGGESTGCPGQPPEADS